MDERRKQPRKDLISYSQVFDVREGYLIGYLGDITLRGAMVISDLPMNTDAQLTISIQLPELENISEPSITMPARIAWCHKDLSPEYFNIGLEFKEITDRQKEIIEAIMENYEFSHQPPNYPPRPSELDKG